MTRDQRIQLTQTLARMKIFEEEMTELTARLQEQISDFQELLASEYKRPSNSMQDIYVERYDD